MWKWKMVTVQLLQKRSSSSTVTPKGLWETRNSSLATTLHVPYCLHYQMVVCQLRLRPSQGLAGEDHLQAHTAADEAEKTVSTDAVTSDMVGEEEEGGSTIEG
jgi:hypothetical protein